MERCMDWVANGPISLTGSNINDANDDDDDNDVEENNLSPEQVMQRQLEELDKRYTLVKRMKQNMGHSALMLSGGGGEYASCCSAQSGCELQDILYI